MIRRVSVRLPGRLARRGVVIAALLLAGCGAAVALAQGTQRRHGGLTAALSLSAHVISVGGTVHGEVVLHNPGSAPAVLERECRANTPYAIGFQDASGHVWAPAFAGVGCPSASVIVARPGTTVLHFRARATYSQCSASPSAWPPSSPQWSPPCPHGSGGRAGGIPMLPPGAYTVVFVPGAPWHGPHVRGAPLTIDR